MTIKYRVTSGRFDSVEVLKPAGDGKTEIHVATFWHTGIDGEAERNAAHWVATADLDREPTP